MLLTLVPTPGLADEGWMLMSHEDGCAEVRLLQRTFPDLGSIAEPHAFAHFVERKGFAVMLEPLAVPSGKALKVTVPAKELFLLFVTREFCSPASDIAR